MKAVKVLCLQKNIFLLNLFIMNDFKELKMLLIENIK